MKIQTSTGESITLTDDQARILLKVVEQEEWGVGATRLRYESNCSSPRRETVTAQALCKKGLLELIRKHEPHRGVNGKTVTHSVYRATLEGFWQGDTLRAHFRKRRSQ